MLLFFLIRIPNNMTHSSNYLPAKIRNKFCYILFEQHGFCRRVSQELSTLQFRQMKKKKKKTFNKQVAGLSTCPSLLTCRNLFIYMTRLITTDVCSTSSPSAWKKPTMRECGSSSVFAHTKPSPAQPGMAGLRMILRSTQPQKPKLHICLNITAGQAQRPPLTVAWFGWVLGSANPNR